MSRRQPGGGPQRHTPSISQPATGKAGYSIFQPSANYLTALADPSRIPAYFVEFLNHTERFGTHKEMNFANMSYLMADAPRSLVSTVRPEQGQASLQITEIPLIDQGNSITAIANDLEGEEVTLRMGFLGLAEEDYISFPIGVADEIDYRDGIYYWTVRDPFSKLNRKIWNVAVTSLTADISATDTTIPVTDTSLFGNAPASAVDETGYIDIGGEPIYYANKTSTAFLNCTRDLFPRHPARTHRAGDAAEERLRYTLHPADMAFQIVTGAGKDGVGLPLQLVDEGAFTTWKENLIPGLIMDWWIDGPKDAFTAFQETCRVGTAYPAINAQGLLSVQDFRFPNTNDDLTVLSTAYSAAASEKRFLDARRNTRQMRRVRSTRINRVQINYDLDRTASARYHGSHEASMGNADWLETYNVPALRPGLPGTELYLQVFSDHILTRYGNNAQELSARLLMSEHILNAGNLVQLTHGDVPDIRNKVFGITDKYFEIINRNVFFPRKDGSGGYVECRMLDTGIDALTKVISSLSVEYGSATAAQQALYAWVGVGDTVGA